MAAPPSGTSTSNSFSLPLPTAGCQTTTFRFPGWNTRELERSIVLHHGMVRIPYREEEGLHELMLVALQAIEAGLFGTAAELYGLL